MAKKIKFNLMLDGKPVRNLEGLQQNYNLDDVYAGFQRGVLARWLEVRGYDEQLAKVKALKPADDEMDVAKKLVEIFDITTDDHEIKKSVYAIQFRREEQERLQKLEKAGFERHQVVADYHRGYEKLLKDIKDKSNDYPFLKRTVISLWKNYEYLLRVDFTRFFGELKERCPLVFFAMLSNDDYRNSGLFDEKVKNTVFQLIPLEGEKNQPAGAVQKFQKSTDYQWVTVTDKTVIIKDIGNKSGWVKIREGDSEYTPEEAKNQRLNGFSFYSNNDLDFVEYVETITDTNTVLKHPYKSFSGKTEGYWKDLEPRHIKCLILKIESGNFIRSQGQTGEELGAEDINGRFPVLDGIDYKSNNADHTLIYMEV